MKKREGKVIQDAANSVISRDLSFCYSADRQLLLGRIISVHAETRFLQGKWLIVYAYATMSYFVSDLLLHDA